jgi:iron complex outermembrane receptor protein
LTATNPGCRFYLHAVLVAATNQYAMRRHLSLTLTMVAAMASYAQTDTSKVLETVFTTGIRAKTNTPVTQYNLGANQLKQVYYGADLPTLLQTTPAVHAYSDNGTGIGYSYFRIRGIDQSRINVTINGVPMNDPENQGTFFNNIADLTSSAQSVQVQRGVGTSGNGTAALGGAVAILTRKPTDTAGAELNLGIGSFGTSRITAEVQTGALNKGLAVYARLSHLATQGFRTHSGSSIASYLMSVSKKSERSVLQFNMWGGDAQSQLAYVGVTRETLDTNRTYNPLVNGERDRFRQHFFQLQYQYQLNNKSSIQTSAYLVKGTAPQFQVYFAAQPYFPYAFFNMPDAILGNDTFTQTDAMVSYRLNQTFAGAFATYAYVTPRFELYTGVHANTFTADHFMETQWMQIVPQGIGPNHRAYFNTGYKQEVSAFVKASKTVGSKLNVFADVQARGAFFQYKAQQQVYTPPPFTAENMEWVFLNPKVGVHYRITQKASAYAMLGQTSREPTRFDYFQDDYATSNTLQSAIKPERVTNGELGFRFVGSKLTMQANLFYMYFSNPIINTGALNAFGYPITTNINQMVRNGIEIDGTWKLGQWIWLTHSSMLSQHTINRLTQYYTDSAFASVGVDYQNTTPSLSPQVIVNQGVRLLPLRYAFVDVNARYVSKQFVDNSSQAIAAIDAYTVLDARLNLDLAPFVGYKVRLSLQATNLLNSAYTAWGNVAAASNIANYDANGQLNASITPLYFVGPPRQLMLTLQWQL